MIQKIVSPLNQILLLINMKANLVSKKIVLVDRYMFQIFFLNGKSITS